MNTKICSKCGQEKLFPNEFYRDRSRLSGYSSHCKKCNKAYQRSPEAIVRQKQKSKEWRKLHPEKCKRYARKRRHTAEGRKKEADYRRIYLRDRRANDPQYREWKRQKDKEYRQSVKGRVARIRAKAKRRSRGGRHKLTTESWQKTIIAFNECCAYCETNGFLTADHFIPISKEGDTILGNIVPACRHCNSSKQDKMPQEWCTKEQLKRVLGILEKL